MRTSGSCFILFCILSAVLMSSRVSGQVSQWKMFTNGNYITDIEADADTVWVGTEGGLVKIVKPTGETTFYNKLNSGLPDNYILTVEVAPDGKKWIGTATGGLSILDGNTWKVFDTANSILESNKVWAIDFDSTGTAWIVGYTGLYKSNYDSIWQFSTVTAYCIKIDSLQQVWIGSNNQLMCFNGSGWHSYELWTFINSLAVSDQGLVWLGTSAGLYKFNGVTFTKINQPLLTESRSVSIAADGDIWVGSYYGVGKLSGSSFEFFYPVDNGMADNQVYEIETDQSNTVWIGTRHGLATFSSPPWPIYNTSSSAIPENYIKSIAIDRYGNKWMGSWDNAGLIKFDGSEWSVFQPDEGTTTFIDHVVVDTNNIKWISDMYHGIQSFNDTSWTYYNEVNSGLPDNFVRSIFADKDNNIWVGLEYYGAAVFDHSGWTYYDTSNTCMERNQVEDICIDEIGNAWFSVDWSTVIRISNSGCEVFNSTNSGLANNFVKRIIADHQGKIWFGMQQGEISSYDGLNWSTYHLGPNGYYTVNDMAVDEANNLWVGTNGAGLYKFDGTEWTNYTVINSGLCCNEILSLAIDSLGTKWIGTEAGLSLFNEDGFVSNHYLTSTRHNLKLYPNPAGESLTISLPINQKTSHIQVLNVNGILIRNTTLSGNQTTIDIHDLTPGMYLIRLQADDGVHVGKFIKV